MHPASVIVIFKHHDISPSGTPRDSVETPSVVVVALDAALLEEASYFFLRISVDIFVNNSEVEVVIP